MPEPSNTELVRRVEEVSKQLADVVGELREDRRRAEQRYVPRELWIEARDADKARVRDVERDVEALAKQRELDLTWRRQVLLALAVAALAAVASFAIALFNIVAGT